MLGTKNTSNAEHGPAKHVIKRRKITIICVLASLLLVAATAATISITHRNTYKTDHSLIKSTCASTLYSDLCVSSLVATPSTTSTISSPMDVIVAALNLTISNVYLNRGVITNISAARGSLTIREIQALKDCIQIIDDSIDELQRVAIGIKKYGSKNYSVDDVMILLSAAMTNQETCIDGFSHDEGDKRVRSGLLEGQIHVVRLCSNVLAMIKNMTGHATAATHPTTRHELRAVQTQRLEEKDAGNYDDGGWPKWLSAGDRRLLQATEVTADVTVAADGSGNYRTVSEAVAAAPSGTTSRYIIRIKAGDYRENVEIPKAKTNLMFVGDGESSTIITANRNVVDGSTTFNSATVAVVGGGFLARDITFQNTAGPSKHQAVALRVNADLTAFYRCSIIAYQDTLYVHSLRQFYIKCIIIGTVDFIFGNAAVVIQDSDIHARRPDSGQKNMVTAQGREDPNENTGIVIQNCRIGATSDLQGQQATYPTYLGRPWKTYSRTVVMQSEISDVINPAGWFEWDGDFALSTLYYAEYANTGPGADTSNRVTWGGYTVLTTAAQAQPFTAGDFISGGNWLPSTGFPFSLGL